MFKRSLGETTVDDKEDGAREGRESLDPDVGLILVKGREGKEI